MPKPMNCLPELTTPTGAKLRFKLPKDQGNDLQWFKTWLCPHHFPDASKKEMHPILGLWGAGDGYIVVAADFDIPADRRNEYTRLKVAQMLVEECPTAMVAASVSGNPRAFFLVKLPTDSPNHGYLQVNESAIFAWLKTMVPEELVQFLDKAGMRRLYVNEELYLGLGNWLREAPVSYPWGTDGRARSASGSTPPGVRAGTGSSIIVPPLSSVTYRRLFESQLPLPEELSFTAKTKVEKHLLRVLSAAWNLIKETGFQLPTTLLADQLGTTPGNVSAMLKQLQRLGLLTCLSNSYIPGKKAKTYQAKGALLRAIQQHKAHTMKSTSLGAKRPTTQVFYAPPKGEFYAVMLRQVARFSTQEEAVAWAETLEGITPKGLALVRRMAACQTRKRRAA